MSEGSGGVERGKAGEGASLVRVEQGAGSGQEGEAGGGDAFDNFGESFRAEQ